MTVVTALLGTKLPDVALTATSGGTVNPSRLAGRTVLFFYPYTGRPGHADPANWDNIPGAHGSTPQCLAYSRHYAEFQTQGVKLFGVSFQDGEWQLDFVRRNALSFPLLSDLEHRFSDTLRLPVFETGGTAYLKRLTLIARDGIVEAVRYPVPEPARDAEETLALLASM